MDTREFRSLFLRTIDNQDNPYHPLVWINGTPEIGAGTFIGAFSEVYSKGARVIIGERCDIGSFVAINVADSHRRCLGLSTTNDCRDIVIEDHVFIGTHCAVLGGAVIGHHSVIAAGTIVRAGTVPPFSLVIGAEIKAGYYRTEYDRSHRSAHD